MDGEVGEEGEAEALFGAGAGDGDAAGADAVDVVAEEAFAGQVEGAGGGVHQEALAAEVLAGEGGGAGERVGGGGDQGERDVLQVDVVERGGRQVEAEFAERAGGVEDERRLQGPGRDAAEQAVPGGVGVQGYLQVGPPFGEAGEDGGHVGGGDGLQGAQAQPGAVGDDLAPGLFGLVEQPPGPRQQPFAGRGEGHAARGPVEQFGAEAAFEGADLLGDGGRGESECHGRGGDGAVGDDGLEDAQLT